MRVLVVEDERRLAGIIKRGLLEAGYSVDNTYDGEEAQYMAENTPYALIILDIMLPGLDGLTLCKQIRAQNQVVPILMLTAKSGEIDRVLGLEIGADDYLTKPFSVRELMARVKAIFRRGEGLKTEAQGPELSIIQVSDLAINVEKRKITLNGQSIDLTAKEFDLLMHFAGNPGRVYSRSQLLDQVWGYGHDGYEHTVNSHINRLRAKIEEDPANPKYILTVWGVGYKFADEN